MVHPAVAPWEDTWPVSQLDSRLLTVWRRKECDWPVGESNLLLYLESILPAKWFQINCVIHPGILQGRTYYLHFLEEETKDQRDSMNCLKSTACKDGCVTHTQALRLLEALPRFKQALSLGLSRTEVWTMQFFPSKYRKFHSHVHSFIYSSICSADANQRPLLCPAQHRALHGLNLKCGSNKMSAFFWPAYELVVRVSGLCFRIITSVCNICFF